MITARQLLRELRNLGFVDTYATRSGTPMRELVCSRDDHELIAQIWADGKHRISHRIAKRETMQPTCFTCLDSFASMYRAIAFEWQRRPVRS